MWVWVRMWAWVWVWVRMWVGGWEVRGVYVYSRFLHLTDTRTCTHLHSDMCTYEHSTGSVKMMRRRCTQCIVQPAPLMRLEALHMQNQVRVLEQKQFVLANAGLMIFVLMPMKKKRNIVHAPVIICA